MGVRPAGMWGRVLMVVVALALVSGCGKRTEPSAEVPELGTPPTTSGAPDLQAVLAGWQEFPVDRRPRPIVLLGSLPQVPGFTTGEAKIAAMAGNYELAAPLPPTPPTVTARLPDGPAELPTLPVEQAFDGLRDPQGKAQRPNPTDALPITRVELGEAQFLTDRGPMTLPSWLFHPVNGLGPIAWPALRPDAFWRSGQAMHAVGEAATLGPDGTTLTVRLPAPGGPCPGHPVIRHEAVVAESATAVAVGVRQVVGPTAPGTPVTECAQPAILRFEPHQVRLAAPLGGRVLLDGRGSPTAVTLTS